MPLPENAVTDYFRSQKKRATFSLSALLHIAMPKSSPEEIVIRDDRHAALFQALAKLSDKERNIIGMKYAAGEKSVNFLISQGGENGIGTTEEVKTEVLAGTKVYFANGIVIWEQNGYTIEMNAREDFDSATLGKVIEGFTVGAALTQAEVEQAKEKYRSAVPAEGAGPVPAEGALPGNSNRCSPGSEKARRCFNAFCKSN
ncbi:RNA polymerase sigma factor [Brevibacillus agri]|uniref:RNA polymerase sigma factor n=1 Tax=Brevibacillus agri TaxID=51101 RepID=UPI003D21B0F5